MYYRDRYILGLVTIVGISIDSTDRLIMIVL